MMASEVNYNHGQRFGLVPIVVLVVLGAVSIVLSFMVEPVIFAIILPLAWFLWTMSRLDVTIHDGRLRWSFRDGFWEKAVLIQDVVKAEPVRNRWWYGWGIHLTPRGFLYNASGLSAVEVTLRNGRRFRLGSDEPEVLAAAVNAEIAARKL